MLRRIRHRFLFVHQEVRFHPSANVSVSERFKVASSPDFSLRSSGMPFIYPLVTKMTVVLPFRQTMACKTKLQTSISVVPQRTMPSEGCTTYCLENLFSWKMLFLLPNAVSVLQPDISSERECKGACHCFLSNRSGTNTLNNGSRCCISSEAVNGSSGGASGFIRRTPVCYFPFFHSASYFQKRMNDGNSKKGVRAEEVVLQHSSQRPSYASSFSLDSSRTNSNAVGMSMLATAAALEKTRNTELMDDKQVAAEASKLLQLLAPVARGSHLTKTSTHLVNGRGARQSLRPLKSSTTTRMSFSKSESRGQDSISEAAGVIPLRTTTYITPPGPLHTVDHNRATSSSSRKSTLAITKPSDTLFGNAVPSPQPFTSGLPSRRPRIPISKWQNQEFEEAFEAAEAVFQEEEREEEEQRKQKKKKRKQKGAAASDEAVKNESSSLSTASSFHLHPATLVHALPNEKEPTSNDFLPSLPPTVSVQPTTVEAAPSPSFSAHSLANPFKGLHEFLYRSYRLDEVLHTAKVTDLVFAKQEPKAAVFSFLSFRSGLPMYRQHWEVREDVQQHHTKELASLSTMLSGVNEGLDVEEEREPVGDEMEAVELDAAFSISSHTGGKKSRSKKNSISKDLLASTNNSTLRSTSRAVLDSSATSIEKKGGAPVISYASVDGDGASMRTTQRVANAVLQWGGLGWDHPGVEVDYSLIVAQRLLLFPPEQRFFHALAGRPNVPCDFFADLDLADFTAEEGEKTLVEVLDYLEVRLPGVGFTDPFFLVLENEDSDEMWCSSDSNAPTHIFPQEGNPSKISLSGPPFTKLASSFSSLGSGSHSTLNGKAVKRKKVSYHIHARSMTHVLAREERNISQLRKVLKQGSRKRLTEEKKKKQNGNTNGASEESPSCTSSSFSIHEAPNSERDDNHTEERGEGDPSLFSETAQNKSLTTKKMQKDEKNKGKGEASDGSVVAPKSVKGAIKTIVFQDYRVVKLIADEINQTLGFNALDEGCYRTSGSLRCAFSRKIPPSVSCTPVSPVNAAVAAVHSLRTSLKDNSRASLSGRDESTGKTLFPITNDSSSEKVSFSSYCSPSIPGLQPALVPARIRPNQHPDLTKKLQSMHQVLQTLTAPEILELTFCTRHLPDEGTQALRVLQEHLAQRICFPTKRTDSVFKATTLHQFKVVKPQIVIGLQSHASSSDSSTVSLNGAPIYSPLNGVVEYDSYGNAVSPYLTEGAKWRRFKMVIGKLESISPQAAMSFDIWVRVGLALHNFSNEEHVFEEWVKFSVKCPQKYSREACKKKWLQFERNPDALNWRRGFNYLNQTLWRQL